METRNPKEGKERMVHMRLPESMHKKVRIRAAEAALELFRDEAKRQEYYGYFRELEDLYEILSPDPLLREFIEDYQKLADLYALLRSAYDNQGITDRELARKTAHLVQEHTQAGVIHEAVAIQEITPQTLRKIAESNQSDTVKVFNLLKNISKKVEEEAGKTPYLFTSVSGLRLLSRLSSSVRFPLKKPSSNWRS